MMILYGYGLWSILIWSIVSIVKWDMGGCLVFWDNDKSTVNDYENVI